MDRQIELILGLEVHVRLDTGGKLFCTCQLPTDTRSLGVNTRICPTCTGHPGAMPYLQKNAVLWGTALALELGADPSQLIGMSRFERKHYFYWDLPKNYQITQNLYPLCRGANTRVLHDEMDDFTVEITRIHLEEDAAKKQEDESKIKIDFNRSSSVLAEIVTEPCFRSAAQVEAFLRHLQRVVRWHRLGSALLEGGDFRCDINMSVRYVGEEKLNPKVELKNVARFDGIGEILSYEYKRLSKMLETNAVFEQETREWNEDLRKTEVLRTKESAADYWYYFEPDLLDVEVNDETLEQARNLTRPSLHKVLTDLLASGFKCDEIFKSIFTDADFGFLTHYAVRNGLSAKQCRSLSLCLKAAVKTLDDRRNSGEACSDVWNVVSKKNLDHLIHGLMEGNIKSTHLKRFADENILAMTNFESFDALMDEFGFSAKIDTDGFKAECTNLLVSVLTENPDQRDKWLIDGDEKLANHFTGELMRRLPKGSDGSLVRQSIIEYYRQHKE